MVFSLVHGALNFSLLCHKVGAVHVAFAHVFLVVVLGVVPRVVIVFWGMVVAIAAGVQSW